ncbi:uncharacterized protein LOC110443638 isoform X2 [Mizuhopecten yessoensis]|uniref:uncharacterized protein LOC110443638 isoform X2 n=1 Tax=Mizuhopecten yessoensis TaxID=6573 RepID=UPI000B45F729|nr:uncharacterized protein LOC110443638 isoform X2 [Mizuhopecten yessoensis]
MAFTIQDKGEQAHPPTDPIDVITDEIHKEVSDVNVDKAEPERLDSVDSEQLVAPRAEVEQFIAPQAEVDVTDLDDPDFIESQDQKEAEVSDTINITTNDNDNDDAILVVHPNGKTQTVVDYVNDIIDAARKRAAEETIEVIDDKSKSKKEKKKSGDSGRKGSRRGSGRSGAVRELISRLFRREDMDTPAEGSNGIGHSPVDKETSDKPSPDKTKPKQNKSHRRPHFKNLLFQKKKKYQVSTEALATDENSRDKIKKRQKVSRANSFGKSLRNILSCSSSVTTV